jgi:hypothetical protein
MRKTPRQAITALLEPAHADWAEPYIVPLALDLAGAFVAVNGVTLSVAGSTFGAVSEIAKVLPFGIDLVVPPHREQEQPALWVAGQHAERGFEKILIVSADAIGVSSRMVSTALSVLTSRQTIAGFSPSGSTYLAGFQSAALADAAAGVDALLRALESEGTGERCESLFESRFRLRDLSSFAEFCDIATGYATLLPRTMATLDRERDDGLIA